MQAGATPRAVGPRHGRQLLSIRIRILTMLGRCPCGGTGGNEAGGKKYAALVAAPGASAKTGTAKTTPAPQAKAAPMTMSKPADPKKATMAGPKMATAPMPKAMPAGRRLLK
ncbi:hypothetical protein OEZ86_002935 [Tetradesmus obliquus]|nr:hypothetical protein OEZ86_002935 [Tetradesmus obliquus]